MERTFKGSHFILPSARLLKGVLSKIPFGTGINQSVIDNLKRKVAKMRKRYWYCSLLFDEISLHSGLHYDTRTRKLIRYEDLGHLGRSVQRADHALVFMVRGVARPLKQVLAYYFTAGTIPTLSLKNLIETLIAQLQNIGLNFLSTVCDQGPTNKAAVTQLSAEINQTEDQFYFIVNEHHVTILYDVPHLLINTGMPC